VWNSNEARFQPLTDLQSNQRDAKPLAGIPRQRESAALHGALSEISLYRAAGYGPREGGPSSEEHLAPLLLGPARIAQLPLRPTTNAGRTCAVRPHRMMCCLASECHLWCDSNLGDALWWAFGGFAALLYLILIVTLGVTTLRNGHWVMFILGIPLPLFWIIGALMPPATPQSTQPV
jgi:hypothetical protein